MGFGHGPYAKLSVLYLPSVTTIGHDAFRRNQYLLKVNLPRAVRVDDFAFDDASRLEYFTAPKLTSLGRNALNDSHALIAVNLPRLRYLGINCFDLNNTLAVLRLPAVTELDKNAIVNFARLRTLYLPKVATLRDDAISHNPVLTRVVLGAQPPVQGARVFTGSTKVTIFHTGTERRAPDRGSESETGIFALAPKGRNLRNRPLSDRAHDPTPHPSCNQIA
jgi:hypothetical protein